MKPGYKQTEVGVIPEDWEIKSLSDLSPPQSLVRGPFGGALKKESFVESGFKVYEQRNAIYKTCDIGSYYINRSKFSEMRRFSVAPGDFIISCSGTIGRIFQIPPEAPPGIINQALLKIRTDERVVFDRFFYLVFEWDQFQARIIDSTQGGAIKNLVGMEVFKKTPFTVPPLPEQRAIAGALGDVDALLGALEKLIAKKRDLKQAAMQQLLTGKKRLHGFGQENKFKQTEIGQIPEDWDVKPLKSISSMKGRIGWQGLKQEEFTESPYDPFLITGMNFKDGKIRWEEVYHIPTKRYEEDTAIQLKTDDVLMTKDGTIGKLLYVDSIPHPSKASLNSHLLVFRPLNNQYIPKFLFYQLHSKAFIQYIELNKSGSTFFGLTQEATGNYMAFLPPIPEQTTIAAMLSDMDAEIEALEQRLAKTHALKQGMMQELLTGKTRLI